MMEILIPLIISGSSLVMISSLSLRNSMAGGNPYSAPLRQFQFLGMGLTLMMLCFAWPSQSVRKNSGKLFALAFFLLVITAIP